MVALSRLNACFVNLNLEDGWQETDAMPAVPRSNLYERGIAGIEWHYLKSRGAKSFKSLRQVSHS